MDEMKVTRNDFARPVSERGEGGSTPPTQLGAYRIQTRLGQGGMGTVYRAWHTHLKRPVALKTLRADYMDNLAAVARFHREMEAVGKLDHPNLIRATDAGEDQGIHFLAMEFVEGVDAAKLSQIHGPLTPADACEVVRQAAVGLQYVHEHHLVHRDLKPSNLMVTPAGQVKVLDLGLALLHAGAGEMGELTQSNQWMGTADYMAPEQGLDAHAVDIRADVYSLGCTLYKLLTGRAPFGGSEYNTPYKKMDAHAHRPIPPLRERRAEVPMELVAIVECMTAKSPYDRFATPGEVAEVLAAFTAGSNLSRLVSSEQIPVSSHAASSAADTGSFGPVTVAPGFVAEEPMPGPTLVARPARRGHRITACIVLGVLGVAAILLASWRPPKEPPKLTPGAWHNVLDRKPEEFLWPRNALAPAFDARKQRLLFSCDEVGLLRLGVTPAAGYTIQIGISQTRWPGGIGVFFGAREEQEGEGTILHYQRIELFSRPPRQVGMPDTFSLMRARGTLHKTAEGNHIPEDLELCQNVLADSPEGHEYILEIHVGRQGVLRAVYWGGTKLPDLVTDQANGFFIPRDYAGGFGVYTSRGTGEITSARVMILEKEKP